MLRCIPKNPMKNWVNLFFSNGDGSLSPFSAKFLTQIEFLVFSCKILLFPIKTKKNKNPTFHFQTSTDRCNSWIHHSVDIQTWTTLAGVVVNMHVFAWIHHQCSIASFYNRIWQFENERPQFSVLSGLRVAFRIGRHFCFSFEQILFKIIHFNSIDYWSWYFWFDTLFLAILWRLTIWTEINFKK